MNTSSNWIRRLAARLVPVLALAFAAGAIAQDQGDPPARVGTLSQVEGTVAFAPAGETEWVDAFANRPITTGDRLWTEKGSRAELHLGSAVLHLDGTTFMDMSALDGDVMQAQLNEGTVNARVRQLGNGENFEIDTPQLAFRAVRPGDYRIDVDPVQHTTRITVRSGVATVYGASGQAQQLDGPQVVTFGGQELERVAVQASAQGDGFDRWAADRNRAEDQSVAARYVPREVVGYQQLDNNGTWSQDATYGEVWYPRVTVADWAPYRYGRWEYIAPWGWTWIDDAPWGFAPFHYGRWAMIGARWAWVPGRIGPRPVYAPALVSFVGGNGWSLSVGGPGIGWFPLGPGEVWRPYYRSSTVYVTRVNRYVPAHHRHGDGYIYQRHAGAVTAVRVDDFNRGRPVNTHWHRVTPNDLGRANVVSRPVMPEPRRVFEGNRPARVQAAPQLNSAPPVALRPPRMSPGQVQGDRATGNDHRWNPGERGRGNDRVQGDERPRALVAPPPREDFRAPQPRQVETPRPRIEPRNDEQPRFQRPDDSRRRDEQRAQEDQRRLQHQQQQQQEQAARQNERLQRQQQQQQEQAARQAERFQRQQQEQAARQNEIRRQQEQVQRDQAVRQQQEQAQREQAARHQQEQAARQNERFQRQQQQQAQQPQAQQPRQQESRERGERGERGGRGQDQREDRRSQAGEEGGREFGRGRGRNG